MVYLFKNKHNNKEVIKMVVDLSTGTIRQIFMQQVKDMTLNKKIDSFDVQFSDRLIEA